MDIGSVSNSSSSVATSVAKQGQKAEKVVAGEVATLISSAASAAGGKGGAVNIKA